MPHKISIAQRCFQLGIPPEISGNCGKNWCRAFRFSHFDGSNVRLGASGLGAALIGGAGLAGRAHGQITTRTHEIPTWSGLTALDRGLELGPAPAERFAAPAIDHVRIGEAILLGRETLHRSPWPGTHQDGFALHAEVIELKEKPSVPLGERAQDAFGRSPGFEDRGETTRALLNVGREDVDVEGIAPRDPRLAIVGASSGYLVVDTSHAARRPRVGEELSFSLSYSALLAAMTSEYVHKQPLCAGTPMAAGA